MKNSDIINLRLHNQGLTNSTAKEPTDVVTWLGAVQSQDYAGAKWALGMRSPGVTDADLDNIFASGAILRTHVMRPTWHFVPQADIRWMLFLTAPRVHAFNGTYYRKLGLDASLLARSNAVLAKALEGGKQLTRQELREVLQRAGIAADTDDDSSLRFGLTLMAAELDGIICSGARRGKQFTYALLEERAPQARTLTRDEALAELTRRYFSSHGPAMIKDFVWWSGLTVADAKAGLEMTKPQFVSETIDGKTYWFSPSSTPGKEDVPGAYFLPNYDEYTIGYTDHDAIYERSYAELFELQFPHSIVVDGRVVGAWKRVPKKDELLITPKLYTPLTDEQEHALTLATERYSDFLGIPVTLT